MHFTCKKTDYSSTVSPSNMSFIAVYLFIQVWLFGCFCWMLTTFVMLIVVKE